MTGPHELAFPSADPGPRAQYFDRRRPPGRELQIGVTEPFSLTAVGDCIASRPMSGYLCDPGFAAVMDVVTSADAAYGNLETSIIDIDSFAGHPYASADDWPLTAHPRVAEDLAALGFRLFSRANNHAMDWGIEGMRETGRWLDAAGLVHAGTGEHRGLARAPRYLETPKGRIGLVSFSSSYRETADALPFQDAAPGRPGLSALHVSTVELVPQETFDALNALPEPAAALNPQHGRAGRITRFGVTFQAAPGRGMTFETDQADVAAILRSIRQAKQNADLVIAALHAHQSCNGHDFGTAPLEPADFLAPLARAAIDAGASAFITTGNHNVGPVEVYDSKPIMYGLGNFFWSDLQEPLPSDAYRSYRAQLQRAFEHPERATDADLGALADAECFASQFTFQSFVPKLTFDPDRGGGLSEFRVYPVTLRYGQRLTRSGIPTVPDAGEAAQILEDVRKYSLPLGTTISTISDDGPWLYGKVTVSLRIGLQMTISQPRLADMGQVRPAVRAPARQQARQKRIVQAAMEHFAVHGYEGARIEAIASQAGVAKGAVFGYFASKAGLFLAAYQAATRQLNRYLDAPAEVVAEGFFPVICYWLEHTPHLIHEDWIPYRVTLLGNYCADLQLKRGITQFLLREDPYGTQEFVSFGISRGEVRDDIDPKMIISLVDWLMDRCQDAIVTEELDPGLFGYHSQSPQMRELRFAQFVELLRSAIGAGSR
jgi:poly-gamma-glutamate capsule biosynthesis protein CapA/YwtB (metallophosphatase superfamily)/AcrR family transcriptional regulator